jgi:hypothetical protein
MGYKMVSNCTGTHHASVAGGHVAQNLQPQETLSMEAKTIECRYCRQKHILMRDSLTGMWELTIGRASISNSSWEYLRKTWLAARHYGCRNKSKEPEGCIDMMEAV